MFLTGSATAADLAVKAPAPSDAPVDWTGVYLGGHIGQAWGRSNWTASNSSAPAAVIAADSFSVEHSFNAFNESGSWLAGVQVGYNKMLANRLVLGVEADISGPGFISPAGFTIGGASNLLSGAALETYTDNVLMSGTVRGRVGYAPGDWLFYATGGFAWSYDQFTLAQAATGAAESHHMTRQGWVAGVGIEAPLIPHWTVKAEYLYTGYGNSSMNFASLGQRFDSSLSEQQVRIGANYQFADSWGLSYRGVPRSAAGWGPDDINIHAQATATGQGYPGFNSSFPDSAAGPKTLPSTGQNREIADVGLSAGFRLWKGAELWFNPEINQGFGVGGVSGIASFTNGEAVKIGSNDPYARISRLFVRQTIDLGGATENVAPDFMQFAGKQTSDRLVLTVGRFSPLDIFDTNKYANNPKNQFLNWTNFFSLPFDFPVDAWGYSYGATAEWYKDRFAFRLGVFDESQTPEGGNSPLGYALDPTFKQFNVTGEIEERHELWGMPGKIKILGYVDRGGMASYADAVAWGIANNTTPAIDQVRRYRSKFGATFNLEQQVAPDVGFFIKAGWMDGRYEPFDTTDASRSIATGISVSGNRWNRPDDTIGVAVSTNYISNAAIAYFAAGGFGSAIGDGLNPVTGLGNLTHPGPERVFEAYYNYAVSPSVGLTLDYQFIANPAYNRDRGPVNLYAGRVHWQY